MVCARVGVQDQYTCAFGGLVHLEFTTALRPDLLAAAGLE
jgi:galactokinase/mevalonate kinase-like predicted kinase